MSDPAQVIWDLLADAQPRHRIHHGPAKVAERKRCPICHQWLYRTGATRFVDGIEYHRVCLGDDPPVWDEAA
jgi:hypothetical protein